MQMMSATFWSNTLRGIGLGFFVCGATAVFPGAGLPLPDFAALGVLGALVSATAAFTSATAGAAAAAVLGALAALGVAAGVVAVAVEVLVDCLAGILFIFYYNKIYLSVLTHYNILIS